jgi:polyferredoxin
MKLDFKTLLNKYSIPLAALVIFTLVGLIVMWYRDIRYFYLFAGMGLMEFSSRVIVIHYPKTKQFFRLSVQFIIGGFLLFWLSIFIGVNFQFPEVFFDLSSGVVTGALIQTLVARVALPFIFGNAFCSRACWTGFFFEMTNSKKNISKPPKQRIEWLAWSYLVALIVVPFAIAGFHNPAEDEGLRRMWIVGENLFIVSVGFALTFISGSRSYCRMLCPFITISGLFSKYALFKITPVEGDSCTSCNKCTTACPMLIDVKELVAEKKN